MNEHEQQDKQTKRQKFHQLARQFGEAVQEAGISEVDLNTIVEETRQQMHGQEDRLKQLQEATRAIGEEVAKSGLSEDELMAKLEEVRQRLFEETYGATHD